MTDKLSEIDKQSILEKDAVIKLHVVANIIKCMDAACQRGAFKGEEMSFVGTIRDTLNGGIQKATQAYIEEKKTLKPIQEEKSILSE